MADEERVASELAVLGISYLSRQIFLSSGERATASSATCGPDAAIQRTSA